MEVQRFMPKTTLICLLDKNHPPDHSFITGMLAQAFPEETDNRVQLVVMRPKSQVKQLPARYYSAVSLPVMPTVDGRPYRSFEMLFSAAITTKRLIQKARQRGERVVLFVRNHPLLALIAACFSSSVDCYVYQSSHPLENLHRSSIKRWLHRTLLRFSLHRANVTMAVSPRGLERINLLARRSIKGMVVPLLADLPSGDPKCKSQSNPKEQAPLQFVYIGTHAPRRELEIVIDAAVKALEAGINANFLFIGGSATQIDRLRSVRGATIWEDRGKIEFRGPIPRANIAEILDSSDVGLSLVPANDITRGMSPTKLAEYMGAGIAVLTSRGVDLQELFVNEANAGLIVDFKSQSIAESMIYMSDNQELVKQWSINALKYAQNNLSYYHYVPTFSTLIGANSKLFKSN